MHLEQFVRYIPALGGVGLLAALAMYVYLKRQPVGTPRMREISGLIETGAMAFLRREYIVLARSWSSSPAARLEGGRRHRARVRVRRRLLGARRIHRDEVGDQVQRAHDRSGADHGQARALEIAFDGGAVMGLAVASLGLLGLGIVLDRMLDLGGMGITPQQFSDFAETMSGFAMGASSIALFARIGGGIYTKAADVGADIVGKVEVGIPEDDPRNPPSSPTTSVTTSATSPAWARTSTRATSPPSSPRWRLPPPARSSPPSRAYQRHRAAARRSPLPACVASRRHLLDAALQERLAGRGAAASCRCSAPCSSSRVVVHGRELPMSLDGSDGTAPFVAVLAGTLAGVAIGLITEYYTSAAPVREIARRRSPDRAPT